MRPPPGRHSSRIFDPVLTPPVNFAMLSSSHSAGRLSMLTSFVAQLGISMAAALAVTWAAIQFLSKAWIEDRLKRGLEELKHEQTQQIESPLAHRLTP